MISVRTVNPRARLFNRKSSFFNSLPKNNEGNDSVMRDFPDRFCVFAQKFAFSKNSHPPFTVPEFPFNNSGQFQVELRTINTYRTAEIQSLHIFPPFGINYI